MVLALIKGGYHSSQPTNGYTSPPGEGFHTPSKSGKIAGLPPYPGTILAKSLSSLRRICDEDLRGKAAAGSEMPPRVGCNTCSSHATSRCFLPITAFCTRHTRHTHHHRPCRTTSRTAITSPSTPGFTMSSAGGPPVADEAGFTNLLRQLPLMAWLEPRSRSGVTAGDFGESWLSCSGTTSLVGTPPQRLQKDIAQRIGPLGEMICLPELRSKRERTRLRKRV
ncbi:hypothetical protein BDP55DRAFT_343369 [Colletotrichum godetiae]|uniref:Uncharacterized protein n=1 Tax=Colletotrichum godetiae TaxID=1209918 RepID=A0AAJ0ATW4_9PEZI|nr:uncharacterized protein BDP55DRAFT_343369 [Colletotrichum godetiae]KAK1690255.1 hypothetical protein BDP55DRAFT_343369 [Colletotrichum godetiae]